MRGGCAGAERRELTAPLVVLKAAPRRQDMPRRRSGGETTCLALGP